MKHSSTLAVCVLVGGLAPGTGADVSFAWGGSDTLQQFYGPRAQDSTLPRAYGDLLAGDPGAPRGR